MYVCMCVYRDLRMNNYVQHTCIYIYIYIHTYLYIYLFICLFIYTWLNKQQHGLMPHSRTPCKETSTSAHGWAAMNIIKSNTSKIKVVVQQDCDIIPTKIDWLKLSGKSPMALGIPPLNLKIMLESNPLKSMMLVQRLGVLVCWISQEWTFVWNNTVVICCSFTKLSVSLSLSVCFLHIYHSAAKALAFWQGSPNVWLSNACQEGIGSVRFFLVP